MLKQLQPLIVIMAIGNELLIGKVLDTNSHWLCRRITEMGGKVLRKITVPDDICEISSEMRRTLQMKPDMIITVGGLGPTFDDKTYQAVAKSLKRRLTLNSSAMKMLESRYEQFKKRGIIKNIKLTKERLKMAKFPVGSTPIANPVGTAPAMLYQCDKTTIISLPGVPHEMEAIFNQSIAQIIAKKSLVVYGEKSLTLKNHNESELAPHIKETMSLVPSVYIKSHPKKIGEKYYVKLHLSTVASTNIEASDNLRKASNIILQRLAHACKADV